MSFFFFNKWQKINTVSQTESKTLLQHHSFKNSITLRPAWTRGVKSKLRKRSSVLEFVHVNGCSRTSVLFYFIFLVTWLKFQKHPKLGDKIVCSEITEFIFLWAAALCNVELWTEPSRFNLFNEQTKTMSLHVHFTPFPAYLTVESLSYYWDSLALKDQIGLSTRQVTLCVCTRDLSPRHSLVTSSCNQFPREHFREIVVGSVVSPLIWRPLSGSYVKLISRKNK